MLEISPCYLQNGTVKFFCFASNGVRQFGKENLPLYLKSIDYNGNMSIVNAIIFYYCHFFKLVDVFGKTFLLNGTTMNR